MSTICLDQCYQLAFVSDILKAAHGQLTQGVGGLAILDNEWQSHDAFAVGHVSPPYSSTYESWFPHLIMEALYAVSVHILDNTTALPAHLQEPETEQKQY